MSIPTAIRAISAVLACYAPAPTLSAQEPVRLSGEVTCPQCVITLDTVLTLGGLDGPGLHVITDQSRVAVDPGGRILVTNLKEAEISVFDPAGTFLQTVGGRGEGPGEYSFISRINATTSSTSPATARRFGYCPKPGTDWCFAGNGQTLWVLPETGNRLVRWDLGSSPRVGSVFDRVVEPFERHNPPHFSLPRSFNVGAMVNDDGLWVAWIAPDPAWTDRLVSVAGDLPDVPPGREYDGWIDLIDPSTGRTIAGHRSDRTSLGFAKGHGYLIMYEETDAGVPYIHLVEPRLTRDLPRR